MELFELLRRLQDPNKRLKWLTAEKPLVIVKPFHPGNNLEQTEDTFLSNFYIRICQELGLKNSDRFCFGYISFP